MTLPPQTQDLAALQAVVESLYHRLPPFLPPTATACLCGLCMTAQSLAQMVATPVREIPADLLRDYIESAHGVPENPDDLRALLPRILDLMVQGTDIAGMGGQTELRRFGDACAVHPALFDPQTQALLNSFAGLMLRHIWTAEAGGLPARYSTLTLTETLLVGGWPPAVVTGALDTLFATATGPAASTPLLIALGDALHRQGHFGLRTLATDRPEAAPALADWLNRLLLSPAQQALLLPLDPESDPWAAALWTIAGDVRPTHFTAAAQALT